VKLLDTGPSERGWHRLERFLTCALRFYWRDVAKVEMPPGDALVRGSIGHVGLAHWYAQEALRRRGQSDEADTFYSPHEAMARVAAKFGDTGEEMLPIALRAVDRYTSTWGTDFDRWTVIGIEKGLRTEFGEGALYTARADLIVRDANGKVWIVDHKFVGRIEDKVFQRYAMSGQFLGLHHLGVRTFGNTFGGLLINAVGCNDGQMIRRSPEPAPWALARFPRLVVDTERRISELQGLGDVNAWPMAVSETSCFTPYGKCDHFNRCRWGPKGGW
jgi:hypothetical protein